MNLIAEISNTQIAFPGEFTSLVGALATVLLVIFILIALLISDSKYWNKWARDTLDICSYPLLITFAVIVVSKIMQILGL